MQESVNNAFNLVGVSYSDIMSADKDHALVTIRYKFAGLKAEIIQCTYIQYRNLKELPDMEICEIIKENEPE